jgi:hypothetical protein
MRKIDELYLEVSSMQKRNMWKIYWFNCGLIVFLEEKMIIYGLESKLP